jgi:hypothetical protein
MRILRLAGRDRSVPEHKLLATTAPITPIALAAAMIAARQAGAQQTIFQGNAATESAWRAAAIAAGGVGPGGVAMETFEGYFGTPGPCSVRSDAVTSLPALGVTLRGVNPGSFPGCYDDVQWAHSGTRQLSNFGFDVPCANGLDYFVEATPGRAIRSVGLWQCDPQGNLTIVAEDRAGAALFQFVALINNHSGNSFGGFVVTTAAPPRVARLRVLGAEGDGWNHLDDLQIVTVCPADFNGSGAVSVQDIFDFLAAYFNNDPRADFNASGMISVQDLFDYLAAYFAGCP